MRTKLTLYGTLVYTLTTFPLAVLWHVILFEQQYIEFGYFEGEPSFAIGFITILIQGAVLSFLFSFTRFEGGAVVKGIKYAMVMGLFFWTSHVLAFVAKQSINGAVIFMLMESFYLIIQFGFFGVLIGLIANKLIKEG